MHRLPAICCLILLIAVCAGCGPIRAITSNKIYMPNGMSGRMVTKVEQPEATSPVQATLVARPPGGSDCPRIALIDVDGLLVNADISVSLQDSENPVALFREKLDRASQDPDVCAYVIRINSPGGGVVASDLMFHEINRLRERTGKPVVAYVMELGTGGGYYLATAADTIYAHPNSITGGIGVIFNKFNLQESMAQYNILASPIKAGENIDIGSQLEPLTQESLEWLQSMANQFHDRFKEVVRRRRPTIADSETTFDGRVFATQQALEHGLIDQVGYLEDAITAAGQQAGVADYAIVMYHRDLNPPRSIYATDGLKVAPTQLVPLSIPGLERSRLPGFLYLWQVDPTLERATTP